MTRTVSIGSMIQQLDGLRDTKALTPREFTFVTSVLLRFLEAGRKSSALSDKQVEVIERIWSKHFA